MGRRGSYPHPVIDDADDVASDFEVVNAAYEATQQDVEITYEVRTDDPALLALLESGAARHSLRWRCSSTISTGELSPQEVRRTAGGMLLRAWLDQSLAKGTVFADAKVLAATSIPSHAWQRQHSDYSGTTFDLEPGDVLADGGNFPFDAEKLYDPLDPPVGSCFRFVRAPNRHRNIHVTYDSDDSVDVQIPAKIFDEFRQFGHRPDLQIAIVVLPALMETLRFIKENREIEPLEGKTWFLVLDKLVEDSGGWDQSVLELAQKILSSPIDTAVMSGLPNSEDE